MTLSWYRIIDIEAISIGLITTLMERIEHLERLLVQESSRTLWAFPDFVEMGGSDEIEFYGIGTAANGRKGES